jgi:hypothetical protein
MEQMKTHSGLSNCTSISAYFLHPGEFLQGQHEIQRAFCEQLGTLADDIWQLGHENLALSLLERGTVDIVNNFEGNSELLASAFLRCSVPQAELNKVVTDMVRRRHNITTRATSTIDGLDRLAAGKMLSMPTHFILSAFQLVEVLSRNIDWEKDILLPLVAHRGSVKANRPEGGIDDSHASLDEESILQF